MILEFFEDLVDIPGIETVLIFDNRNRLIDSWSNSRYNPKIFNDLGETFWHIWGLIEYLNYNMDEIAVPFEKGILFAKTREKLYVTVISKASVEIPLIRLAVHVGLTEIERNRKGKKMLKRLPDKKFHKIRANSLDDVEKIMLENILED